MDVEMNHVGRDVAAAEFAREVGDHRVRVIAVAALMVAQRPARRQRRSAGESGITCDRAIESGSRNYIVPKLTAIDAGFGHVGDRRPHPGGKIEFRAERIIVKDSVRDAIANAEVERNGGVNRHVAGAIAEPIRIPEWEDRSVAKQLHRLLAESIVASARWIA